ncbi:MAG: hypothetical protein ABI443_06885 [Chthoniobacterales bacterium]
MSTDDKRGVRLMVWGNPIFCARYIPFISLFLVLLLIVWGWIIRQSVPTVPLADPDSWGYLYPALSWVGGAGFVQADGRGFLYPAILAIILKCGAGFSAITFCQQFLGLSGAIVIWIIFSRWLSLFDAESMHVRIFGYCLITLAIALYVLSPSAIIYERFIRPESMMIFFILCYFLLLVSYFIERWQRERLVPAVCYGGGALICSYFVCLLKPSWDLAFLASFLPLLVGLIGRGKRMIRFAPLALGLMGVVLLTLTPGLLKFKTSPQQSIYLPYTLVSIHAEQIVESEKKRFATATPEELQFILALEKALIEARKNPKHFETLGYQADDIMYRSGVFIGTKYNPEWDNKKFLPFCYALYAKAWIGAPGLMLKKVGRQLTLFLFPSKSDYYYSNREKQLTSNYQHSLDSLQSRNFRPPDSTLPAYTRYLEDLHTAIAGNYTLRFPRVMIFFGTGVAYLSLAIQIVFLITLALNFKNLSISSKLAGLYLLSLLFCMYAYIGEIAIVHVLDNTRYRTTFTAFFIPLLAITLTFTIAVILPRIFPSRIRK